ncbi:MAG: hypothetical protein LBH46_01350 [Rickettsiales bacterium]|jgi:hypothetical protein|nr:hypothetical protein [Rickettsiales bacterium]
MSDIIVNGNIESSLQTAFVETYYILARQRQSYLANTPAIIHRPFKGQALAISRAGAVKLNEDNSRNPLKNYTPYTFDRRFQTKRSFTLTIPIDRHDVFDAIADPKSPILQAIIDEKNKLFDKVVHEAAIADVRVGDDYGTSEVITALQDGVVFIDATSAYNFDTLRELKRSFGNVQGGFKVITQTQTEEEALFAEEKFINSLYRQSIGGADGNTVNPMNLNTILGFSIISAYQGSDNGQSGIGTIEDPIIPEDGGVRHCLCLAENSIQAGVTELDINFQEYDPLYAHSSSITFNIRISAVRLDGRLVRVVNTTI